MPYLKTLLLPLSSWYAYTILAVSLVMTVPIALQPQHESFQEIRTVLTYGRRHVVAAAV